MKPTALAVALSALNVVLFVFSCRPAAHADDVPSVVRARALEIVDDHGRVRASLQVLPGSDTSILRLSDENGHPAVKLAASDKGSSLAIIGGTDANYVVVNADDQGPVIRTLAGGHERRLLP